MAKTYDFIVLGAGSAGCVVASRLSEDPDCSVLLLEAGPANKSPWIKIPAGVIKLLGNPDLTWQYWSEPEPHLNGRKLHWPRGRTLGGTGSINGLAYIRGNPADYDEWAQRGCTAWDWQSLLPIFKDIENHRSGASELHGSAGRTRVSSLQHRVRPGTAIHKATSLFIDGAIETGIPANDDFNGPVQEGVGWVDHNVTDRGRRCSSADAYLGDARQRSNLDIWTDALVERIDVERRQAAGVTVLRNGSRTRINCAREVIVCAGAINTPQILMLSGIGPEQQLSEHGIRVVVDSPGVGQNFQDHTYLHWVHEVERGYSINAQIAGYRLLPSVLEYFLEGRGNLTTGASTAYLFTKSDDQLEHPDVQIAFRPLSNEQFVSGQPGSHSFPGWSASVCYLKPKSRGAITLRSNSPSDPPKILGNYLAHDDDLRAMRKALRVVAEIYESESIKSVLKRRLTPEQGLDFGDEDQLNAFIRSRTANMHHVVGTCAMGGHEDAVLDSRLQVRGISGLRVADTSVMPTIVAGNTYAAAVLIGEKAASMIIEDNQNRPRRNGAG